MSDFDMASVHSQYSTKKGDNLQLTINEIQKKFHTIKITPRDLIMDQFYSCFRCTNKGSQAYQRKRIMEAGYKKTYQQFDVVSLMNKINLSFNVLKNVVTKDQKKLLKFNKS
tara:strand:+ start:2219 stop:2554 length:336 start_codon:yes stop_codon:yes gene_type:complete